MEMGPSEVKRKMMSDLSADRCPAPTGGAFARGNMVEVKFTGPVRLSDHIAECARKLGATPADMPGLWNVPGYPELTTAQMLSAATQLSSNRSGSAHKLELNRKAQGTGPDDNAYKG